MKRRIIIALIVAVEMFWVTVIFAFTLPLGIYRPKDTTMYSPGYREWVFWTIPRGSTKQEVLQRLGPPLGTDVGTFGQDWPVLPTYDLDASRRWNYTQTGRGYNGSVGGRALLFDSDGRLVGREWEEF